MENLAVAGSAAFMLSIVAVGVRLLVLWHRTGELPELACGMGLSVLALFTLPLMIASGVGRVSTAELNLGLAMAAMVSLSVAFGCLFFFTWTVFRPDSRWGGGLTLTASVSLLAIGAAAHRSWTSAAPDTSSLGAAAEWLVAVRFVPFAWYLWNGIESMNEYRKARRRLSLGLSDPLVANRFLLWGLMSAFALLEASTSIYMQMRGMTVLVDPMASSLLGANGVICGGLLLVTFLPPRAYVDFVQRRAGAAGA